MSYRLFVLGVFVLCGTTADAQVVKQRFQVQGHTDRVSALDFGAGGRLLASGGGGGDWMPRVWDVATGKEQIKLGKHDCAVQGIGFLADDRTLVVGGAAAFIAIWDAAKGRLLESCEAESSARHYAFRRDGKGFALVSYHGESVLLHDLTRGKGKASAVSRFEWKLKDVQRVAWSPDGKTLATAYLRGVRLLDVATRKERPGPEGQRALAVAYSPDGKLLACGRADGKVCLWQVATGKTLHTLSGHTRGVTALSFSGDGRYLVSGDANGGLRWWSVADGRLLAVAEGPGGAITSVAASRDGKLTAAGTGKGRIALWEVSAK